MPCFKHRYGKVMLPFEDRVALCNIAASGESRIIVSPFEEEYNRRFPNHDGSTLSLMLSLTSEKGAKTYFNFIIGLDNALEFHKWKNHKDLQALTCFIIIPRPGYQHDPEAWYTKDLDYKNSPRHSYMADVQTSPISSSHIRAALQEWNRLGETPEILQAGLNPQVLKYIVDHNLYR